MERFDCLGVMLAQNVVSQDNAKISRQMWWTKQEVMLKSRDICQDEILLNAADEARNIAWWDAEDPYFLTLGSAQHFDLS
jgi:hypothetical protein